MGLKHSESGRGDLGSEEAGATKTMTRTSDFIPRKPVEGQEHGSNNLTLGYVT